MSFCSCFSTLAKVAHTLSKLTHTHTLSLSFSLSSPSLLSPEYLHSRLLVACTLPTFSSRYLPPSSPSPILTVHPSHHLFTIHPPSLTTHILCCIVLDCKRHLYVNFASCITSTLRPSSICTAPFKAVSYAPILTASCLLTISCLLTVSCLPLARRTTSQNDSFTKNIDATYFRPT